MRDDVVIKVVGLGKRFERASPDGLIGSDDPTGFWALRNVSFEIKKGESVGIIGPNGSGKSTLLKILAGVTRPTEGRVEINGRVASILEIGSGFHPELTGLENIHLNGSILGFSKKEITPQVDSIIEFSGIKDFINEPVKNYSSGMYVRLAFSIMAHLPFDVYLLDEVMTVGDISFSLRSSERMRYLRNKGCSFVVVSHVLADMAQWVDSIIRLDIGRLYGTQTNDYNTVNSYLSSAFDNYLHQHGGHDLSKSCIIESHDLGSEEFSLSMISVSSEKDSFKTDFERNKGIHISSCCVLHSAVDLHFGVTFMDLHANAIFTSMSLDTLVMKTSSSYSSGQQKITHQLEIPAYFMNSGLFQLRFFFIIDTGSGKYERSFEVSQRLVIHVAKSKMDNQTLESIPGLLRPRFNWRMIMA